MASGDWVESQFLRVPGKATDGVGQRKEPPRNGEGDRDA